MTTLHTLVIKNKTYAPIMIIRDNLQVKAQMKYLKEYKGYKNVISRKIEKGMVVLYGHKG